MILYLCRHGSAEEIGEGGATTDAARALTETGAEKFRRAAKGFAHLDPRVRHILTSPLLRAKQTAEILREVLGKSQGSPPRLNVSGALDPPGEFETLLREVRELATAKAGEVGKDVGVVVVGHDPTLSAWVGKLCFGRPGNCELKKGGIAAVDLGEAGTEGRLLWLLPPGVLREL